MSEMQGRRRYQANKKGQKSKKKINYKLVTLIALGSIVLLAIVLAVFIGITLAKNYELDSSKLDMIETSTIYDRNGNEVDQMYKENRHTVPFQDMPELVKQTFVAVEDQRFHEHQGVDFRAIARALYRDIIARSAVEGGSTITQQLAKNVFLSSEKTLMRKTEEVLIAVNLEQRYSKNEILEMYLNYIYYGEGAHGIQAASQTYFAKDVSELELAEIAMLAALPRAPNNYSPLKEGNKERSEQRRLLVLSILEDQGIISAQEREEAANTELQLNTQGVVRNPAHSTYVDMILNEAEEKYDITRDDILTGGYDIYTSLDVDIQEAMYQAFRPDGEFAEELFPAAGSDQIVQGSMVMLDQYSGAVVALMGSRDYSRGDLNWATTSARSPGSSFKPISVYAPALESGYHPYDILEDKQETYGGGYSPQNYNRQYQGQVTMIEAVERSLNAPAAWLLNEMGVDKGISYSQAFGLQPKEDSGLGIALGDIGVSPLNMTKAFSSFANDGVMMDHYFIDEIRDSQGDVVAQHQSQYQQTVNPQASWYMTEMLKSAIEGPRATGSRARMNHPVAGKTGTVQNNALLGNEDAWFIGYTPYYTAGVWIGFEYSDEEHSMDTTGGNHPALIFQHVMSQALEGKEVISFQKPDGVDELEPPVNLNKIGDLKAFLTMHWDLSLQVDLEFTPSSDARVAYNIYRMDSDDSDSKTLIAEKVSASELFGGNGWSDSNISLLETYAYEIVPVNTLNGLEGEPSNRATVEVSPEYPFFRKEGVSEEDFDQWLIDEGFKEEEETEEEEEPEEEEEEQEESPGQGEGQNGEVEDPENDDNEDINNNENDNENGNESGNGLGGIFN